MAIRLEEITICCVILSLLTVSPFASIFYGTADAQVNSNTLESIVNQTRSLNSSAQIIVDGSPQYIFGDLSYSDTIYVANFKGENRNGTVTAIDTTTYEVKNIPVGVKPESIFGDLSSNLIYVLHPGSWTKEIDGSISVIDTTNNTVKANIPVGSAPTGIFGDLSSSNLIYVTNYYSDSVSVINTTDNTVIENVPVGVNPKSIFIDRLYPNLIYVLNSGSDTVSVIDTSKYNVTDNTYNVTDISIGILPIGIIGDLSSGILLYVAGSLQGNEGGGVSVIDSTKNTVKTHINIIGGAPIGIFGGLSSSDLYSSSSLVFFSTT